MTDGKNTVWFKSANEMLSVVLLHGTRVEIPSGPLPVCREAGSVDSVGGSAEIIAEAVCLAIILLRL